MKYRPGMQFHYCDVIGPSNDQIGTRTTVVAVRSMYVWRVEARGGRDQTNAVKDIHSPESVL